VRGHARLDGERRVRIGDDVLVARDAVVIAVGSGALVPPIPGLREVGAWSNRELTTTDEVPGRMIVLGGGVVGVEMAAAWASLGSRVTIIEALHQLLPREEPFAGDELQAALERLGIDVRTGARATGTSRTGREITMELDSGRARRWRSGARRDRAQAADRRPRTEDRRPARRWLHRSR
jgi:dihydrolipoamide dehydrogenase